MAELPPVEVPSKKPKFNGVVKALSKDKIELLRPILEAWIKDSDSGEIIVEEVNNVVKAMETSIAGKSDIHYLVAEAGDSVVGVIGFRPLVDEKMLALAKTDKPVELINAYVDPNFRGTKGVGRALLSKLEEETKAFGYKEVLLNSGPRYKDSGWGFYNRVYGEPVGILNDFYGAGRHAPVWRKSLI